MEFVASKIEENVKVMQALASNSIIHQQIATLTDTIINMYRQHNGVVYFMGNGGSAADAQHLAAELVSRFYLERPGLAAQALHTNTSVITAVGNDYSYEKIYEKQIEAFVRPHDVVIGLSTSGNSKNVVLAIELAKQKGAFTVGFTGSKGGKLKEVCDLCICVPSDDTPRIQEGHILLGHIFCEMVEARMVALSKASA